MFRVSQLVLGADYDLYNMQPKLEAPGILAPRQRLFEVCRN